MAEDHVRGVRPEYPFSAFVGNERAKNALVCALASPDISSVLICGPTGTGKSVLARSISAIGGGRNIVNMPLGSTEDGVFGGIDVEDTLTEGRRVVTEGLLGRADGNILLVENINLLPLSLVFQITNAAETGMSVVERDGVSGVTECAFLLVATMDSDEGILPDHVLDRFDVCVFLSSSEDEDVREEIVRRRMEFETDPSEFIAGWAEEDSAVASRIAKARGRVRFTRVPDGYLSAIAEVCSRLNVSGHRGDISVMNAACSLAALDDRDMTTLDDLKEAAAICLEHRRNDPPDQNPPEDRDPDQDQSDDQSEEQQDRDPQDDREQEREPEDARQDRQQEEPEEPDVPLPPPDADPDEEVFDIGDVFRVIDYMPSDDRVKKARSGKQNCTISEDTGGRCIGYRIPRGRIEDVALVASIRAAAPYQMCRDHGDLAIVLRKEDLREKVRERRQGSDILFLVDGSGSIGAQKRMVAVKGAILSMLKDAYQKRDSIGMAVFRADRAEEVLPLTRSILHAYKTLAEIPTGGRTPLIHGLIKGYDILKDSAKKGSKPVMVILSDGRCNVPYTPGSRPVEEMLSTASAIADSGIQFIVIDTEAGRMRFDLALDLCRALRGTYLHLEDLNADYIAGSVRTAMDMQ